jgi:hypothetical protein
MFKSKKISEKQGLYMCGGLENRPPLDSWKNKENNLLAHRFSLMKLMEMCKFPSESSIK